MTEYFEMIFLYGQTLHDHDAATTALGLSELHQF